MAMTRAELHARFHAILDEAEKHVALVDVVETLLFFLSATTVAESLDEEDVISTYRGMCTRMGEFLRAHPEEFQSGMDSGSPDSR